GPAYAHVCVCVCVCVCLLPVLSWFLCDPLITVSCVFFSSLCFHLTVLAPCVTSWFHCSSMPACLLLPCYCVYLRPTVRPVLCVCASCFLLCRYFSLMRVCLLFFCLCVYMS